MKQAFMKCQSEKFQLQKKYAYLNCADMSPLMKKVEKAGIKGIKRKRKPFHIEPDDFFHDVETVRLLYSKLIDNEEKERVVIIPSVSYGMATVIGNLPFKDGKIIMIEEPFSDHVSPWKALEAKGFTVESIQPPHSEKRGQHWNQAIIDAIDEKTRVVAMGHVHGSDGTLFQLEKIRERLDEAGGLLVIDGTQSVGVLPFSVKKYRPDAVICASYKWLMGPYAIGLAYYGSVFDNGVPLERNRIDNDDFAGLVDDEANDKGKALRYEVGEYSHFIAVPMMHAALKQILRWKPEHIQTYCKGLTEEPIQQIMELGYSVASSDLRAEHLLGVRLPGQLDPGKLKQSLMKNRVRVSVRGDTLRVAPHLYNDERDMRRLIRALAEPVRAV